MSHFRIPTRFAALLCGALLGVFAGCSPKARLDRHVANGQRFMAEGNYAAAEIEFINAERLDSRNAAAMAGLGSIYFDQGSVAKAVPRLVAARDLAPDLVDARVRLARTFITLGRSADARNEALSILGRRADDPEALMILAETATTPEQIAEARTRMTADHAAFHVALAMLDLREGRIEEAATRADRALALDPKLASAHALQAAIALLRNDPDGAHASFKNAAALSPPRSQRRLALARFEASRGDTAAARAGLEDTLRQAPDFMPAAIMLAELVAGSGSSADAQKILDEVLQRDPGNPEATLLRARIHLNHGETTVAIGILEQLVSRFPESAQIHHLLATAYVAANDTTRAMASLTRTLQLAPDHVDAIIVRAALQMRSGDVGSAVPALREVVRQHPGNNRARVLLADALRSRGQPDDALQVYREAIQAAPADPQLRFFAGVLHARLGQAGEARRSFDAALRLKPDYTTCLEQVIALDLAAGDLAAAGARAQAHVAAYPDNADAHVLAAKVAVARADTAGAEAALRRAIEVNPDSAVAYGLLAQLYLTGNRQDEALANLQTAVAKNPRDVSSLMLAGILHQQKGEMKAAREAYERLLLANPAFVPALNNLAYLCSEEFGEIDKAYELANRARELRPNDPVALDTFGWILFQRRDYTWAASVLAESASKLTSNPEVHYHLGMTRYMLGDESGARTALGLAAGSTADFRGKDQAVAQLAILDIEPAAATDGDVARLAARAASAPDDPIAATRLAAIHALRGNHSEALATYETILKARPDSATAMISLAGYLLTRPDGLARAFDLAKAAYKIAPEDPVVLHTLGRSAFLSGDHAWAASLLREAVRRAPESADVQFDFARAAYAVGQVEDAATALRTLAGSASPGARTDEARRLVAMIEALTSTPVPSAALEQAAATIAAHPRDVPALMLSGAGHEQRGDPTAALAAYDAALAIYPRFTPALKRRAVLLAREDPTSPRAFEAASRAREVLPNDAEIAAALGAIHYRRAELPRAATLLGEAARATGASAETLAYLGLAQRQLGERDRSRAALQRALDLGLSGPLADEVRAALATP